MDTDDKLVATILSYPTIAELDSAINELREKVKSKLSHLPSIDFASHRQQINTALDAIHKLDNKVMLIEENLLPLLNAYREEKQEEEFKKLFDEASANKSRKFPKLESQPSITQDESKINTKDDYTEIKIEYIAKAREISTRDIYTVFEVTPDYVVIKSATVLVDLAMQILSEAEFDEDTNRQLEMYNLVKKIIDVYMIVLPVKYESSLRSDPKASSLLHHSLMFIAHFLMKSPQILESPVDFSDMIQRLLDSADAATRLTAKVNN